MAGASRVTLGPTCTRPNLVVIGAMRCGTTSLHYYLSLHPEINMSRPKELNFFIENNDLRRGLEWYRSHFKGDAFIHGESSPRYTNFPFTSGVPARMHSVVPDAKLIYMVRDPIERMISHYILRNSRGTETRPVEEALRQSENLYVARSRYYWQLEQFLPFYPPSRILVLGMSDLGDRRAATLRRVFEFLDVEPGFSSWRYQRRLHRAKWKRRKTNLGVRLERTSAVRMTLERVPDRWLSHVESFLFLPFSRRVPRPQLSPSLRRYLIEGLEEDVSRLRAFTGEEFEDWCL